MGVNFESHRAWDEYYSDHVIIEAAEDGLQVTVVAGDDAVGVVVPNAHVHGLRLALGRYERLVKEDSTSKRKAT